MYKLVAIDLDGTLLNSFGEVTKETEEVVKQAGLKGTHIVLASGRVTSSIKSVAENIGASRYLISGNGAAVYDREEEKILYDKYLDKALVLKIIDICDENTIYYNIYTEESVITNSLKYNVLFYNVENYKKPADKRTNINIVQNVKEYVEKNENQKFLKITICDSNKSIFNSIIKKLRKIKNINVLDVAHMSKKKIKLGTKEEIIEYFYTEISSLDVDKWNAIEFLIKKLDIKEEEVIAIGDNVNDKEMIIKSGLGVAMGNSVPYIKEIADIVCKNNNEEGVKEVIEKYILNGKT